MNQVMMHIDSYLHVASRFHTLAKELLTIYQRMFAFVSTSQCLDGES
jgi:uncharacterized protein (UPF0548 family)